MIIAIFGKSSSGKTTLAKDVHGALNLPLRCCGEEVKARAAKLGVSLDKLTDDVHRLIDQETIRWVVGQPACIVEGRYLDRVLSSIANKILLVELIANTTVRFQRSQKRSSHPLDFDSFLDAEEADLAFRERMYSMEPARQPFSVIDSSELSVEACTSQILALVDPAQFLRD